ncbi:MAG: hypothetical protein ACPHID_01565 [Thermoplasmatota archaeon]
MKEKGLPPGMLRRLGTMFWFTLALGFTGFGNATELITMPGFGWIGVAIAMGMFLLWRDRTRPRANGFWILMGIIWFAFVLIPIRPYLGIVAALPVALLWLHDSPATPSAMLTWGLVAVLAQDPVVWELADVDTAFYVILAMTFVIGAAQSERERLATQYAPTSRVWMLARLAALLMWSLTLLAARDNLTAINLFTYLGFDLSGVAGKATVLLLMLLALASAALLFRVRPVKQVDPFAQPRDKQGRRVARELKEADFDAAPKREKRQKSTPTAPDANVRPSPATPKAPKPKPAGALKPGEIDFD